MADLKALMKRFNDEVMTQGKIEVIDEIVSEDLVEHAPAPSGSPEGREGVKAFVQVFRTAFPDLKATTVAAVQEGDEAWMQSTITGTHKGEFMGIPATNKKFEITAFDRVRFKDGKAVEHWAAQDDMGMMTQLGIAPEPG
jgi:steroid delta-isomerase-like uncharacterized protein